MERDPGPNAAEPLHADRLQVDPSRPADLSLFVVLVHAAVPATPHRGEDQDRDLIGNLIVGELRADDLRDTASLLRHMGDNTGIIWSSHEIQGQVRGCSSTELPSPGSGYLKAGRGRADRLTQDSLRACAELAQRSS